MEKYIHYCWFGDNKLSKLAKKCIKSWKKYLPDYEIIEWNEKNFDVNITKFSKKAYKEKKWAFVSDVARVYALKKMGGIYFDTDMMITKKIDESILEANFFVGWESDINIAVGVIGATKENEIINKLFDVYKTVEFDANDLYRITIPRILTNLLKKEYKMQFNCFKNQVLANNTHIYSRDYFYPISSDVKIKDAFTKNTCMIHYYSGSWLPRDQQLQMKFAQIFGRKLGKFLLSILVKIKHTYVFAKGVLKKIGKFFLYPLVKMRRIRYRNYLLNLQKQKIDEALDKVKTDYMVLYNEDWLGIKTATKELFGDSSTGINEFYEDEIIDYCAEKIVSKNIKFISFSGFSNGWDRLVYKIKELNNDVQIKVIWHGSICMNIYDYDYSMLIIMFKLLKEGNIKSIAFVKKSMYEFFKKKGFYVEFLSNNLVLDENEKLRIKETKKKMSGNNNEKIKIGIYASGDRWVKNFYNQMAAASLIKNCVVDCIPINYKAYELAEIFDLEIKGLTTTISHSKLLERMAQNDINLYVTFSECAPIIPLESLELGVPCITGNNHHYFEGTELEKYLVVNKPDDVNVIYQGIKRCLENKEKILAEYKIWKEKNNINSQNSVKNFLEN